MHVAHSVLNTKGHVRKRPCTGQLQTLVLAVVTAIVPISTVSGHRESIIIVIIFYSRRSKTARRNQIFEMTLLKFQLLLNEEQTWCLR